MIHSVLKNNPFFVCLCSRMCTTLVFKLASHPHPPPLVLNIQYSSLLAYGSQASRKEHTLRNQNAYCKINFHHLHNIEIEVQTLLRRPILCAGAVISSVSFLELFGPIPRVTYPTTWHFYRKLKWGADIFCTNFENTKPFFFLLFIHPYSMYKPNEGTCAQGDAVVSNSSTCKSHINSIPLAEWMWPVAVPQEDIRGSCPSQKYFPPPCRNSWQDLYLHQNWTKI